MSTKSLKIKTVAKRKPPSNGKPKYCPAKVSRGYKTTTYDTGGIEVMGNITAARKRFPELTSSQVEILYMIYRNWTWEEITRLLGMTDEELMAELLQFDITELGILQIREEQNWKVQEQIQAGWE